MSTRGGVYVCRRGYQPVVVSVDERGELVWGTQMKEPWHLKLFPVPYGGDFCEQWMYKSLQEKGFDLLTEDQI